MPDTPIVDSHLHIWDPRIMRYPWLDEIALLARPYLLDDHARDWASVDVEAMVFLQCEAALDDAGREADWVAAQATSDPRIRGMVACAPLERGRAAQADVERLSRHAILRGIRRNIQAQPDLDFCLRPDFIEGVRMLAEFGLTFDICVDHRHMANVVRFVERVPEVPMILDHIGKPSIRTGTMQPWASQMRELAGFPHVHCKVSGVATEAAPDWTDDDLKPFIEVAFAEFGIERTMFGGDWPVALLAIEPPRWIALLDTMLTAEPPERRRLFWRDNANAFYRLGLPA
jgi:L-fuconolactonase